MRTLREDNRDSQKTVVRDDRNGDKLFEAKICEMSSGEPYLFVSATPEFNSGFNITVRSIVKRQNASGNDVSYVINNKSSEEPRHFEFQLPSDLAVYFEDFLDKYCDRKGQERFPEWTMREST